LRDTLPNDSGRNFAGEPALGDKARGALGLLALDGFISVTLGDGLAGDLAGEPGFGVLARGLLGVLAPYSF
jgi:hypothetical protein